MAFNYDSHWQLIGGEVQPFLRWREQARNVSGRETRVGLEFLKDNDTGADTGREPSAFSCTEAPAAARTFGSTGVAHE